MCWCTVRSSSSGKRAREKEIRHGNKQLWRYWQGSVSRFCKKHLCLTGLSSDGWSIMAGLLTEMLKQPTSLQIIKNKTKPLVNEGYLPLGILEIQGKILPRMVRWRSRRVRWLYPMPVKVTDHSNGLTQESADVSCKGPTSKYFRLCWPYGLYSTHSTNQPETIHKWMNVAMLQENFIYTENWIS